MDQKRNPAFVSAFSIAATAASQRMLSKSSTSSSFIVAQKVNAPIRRRAFLLRMTAETSGSETGTETGTGTDAQNIDDDAEGTTSASDILKEMRADVEADPTKDEPKSRSMLGVYRDVDGKSNVWAVEPLETTDENPQISKTIIIAIAAGFIAAALLILPLLPFTNPDQV